MVHLKIYVKEHANWKPYKIQPNLLEQELLIQPDALKQQAALLKPEINIQRLALIETQQREPSKRNKQDYNISYMTKKCPLIANCVASKEQVDLLMMVVKST